MRSIIWSGTLQTQALTPFPHNRVIKSMEDYAFDPRPKYYRPDQAMLHCILCKLHRNILISRNTIISRLEIHDVTYLVWIMSEHLFPAVKMRFEYDCVHSTLLDGWRLDFLHEKQVELPEELCSIGNDVFYKGKLITHGSPLAINGNEE